MTAAPRVPLLPAAAALVALGFAAFTGHAWEDYFITFRSSLNLALGHGLVFQPGERIHSFTSPLGTLLPALFALGGGDGVELRALWGLRLVSALALAAALALALDGFRRSAVGRGAAGTVAALWILDPKIVGFAINGMESAFVVLGIVLVWHALAHGPRPAVAVGGLALLQWTRPDGFVFFVVLGLAWLALARPRPAAGSGGAALPLRARFLLLVRVGAFAFALYLPWLVGAWLYFGSPLPHTIVAKIPHHPAGELLPALALFPWRLLFGHAALHDVFLPAYHFFGGWPDFLRIVSRLFVLGAALAWLWPAVPRAGRVASLAFCLGGFYVEYLPRSPWYYPGWQALALLAWAFLGHAAFAAPSTRAPALRRSALRLAAALAVLVQAGTFAGAAFQFRHQQAIVEDGHRRELGRWLARTAAPGDRVFLECLGYVGYYSGLRMLDFPGLASPEVVAARRRVGNRWSDVVADLKPEWLVLRPWDAERLFGERPALARLYVPARTFDVRAAVEAPALLPGRGFLAFDAVFFVFKLRPVPIPGPP